MSSFIRPIGVHRDISELEYISALLQSHQHYIRSSGAIKADDIAIYLKSRNGIIIIISEAVIDQLILTDLAGQVQNNENHHQPDNDRAMSKSTQPKSDNLCKESRISMDISQLTAILLIPELLEVNQMG
jgi:hypothetical protein